MAGKSPFLRLSAAGRAGARRLLRANERLLWAGEARGMAVAWPNVLALTGALAAFSVVAWLGVPGLAIAVDAIFGANRTHTPKGVAIALGVFVAGVLAMTGIQALKAIYRMLTAPRRGVLITRDRVVTFDATLEPGAALHEKDFPIERMTEVAVRRAPVLGAFLRIKVIHLPSETESGQREIWPLWLQVGSDAQGACDALAAQIARRDADVVSPDPDAGRSREP